MPRGPTSTSHSGPCSSTKVPPNAPVFVPLPRRSDVSCRGQTRWSGRPAGALREAAIPDPRFFAHAVWLPPSRGGCAGDPGD